MKQRSFLALTLLPLVALLLAACSSPPTPPPEPDGAVTPANSTPDSLQELVRAAVAASNVKAQKFTAIRGELLRDVLIRWAKADNARLIYQTEFNPALIGAINEPDIRAAGVALSVLLQNERDGAVIDFSQPNMVVVKDHIKPKEPKK